MKTTLQLLLFSTLLAGCGIPIAGEGYPTDVPRRPNQDQAQEITWYQGFSINHEWMGPPPVNWRYDASCTDSSGTWPMAFWAHNNFTGIGGGGCWWGVYYEIDDHADVEWRGDDNNFHGSSYPHELCHAFKLYTTGDEDGDHHGDCFSAPGWDFNDHDSHEAPDSIVGKIRVQLQQAGL